MPTTTITETAETTEVAVNRKYGLSQEESQATDDVALIYLRVSTSRQANKDAQAEGYSIPAQREACLRKAKELGITVDNVEEFVDAGASARSADRDGLQDMLERLNASTGEQTKPVKYVIVHKLDRLARDRFDDVSIQMAIMKAGAQLISVSEQIDESPSGMLMHGIMATLAEYYSRNLSNEAKKGIEQKIRNGGTLGAAPIGYLNIQEKVNGCITHGVTLDEERAPLIRWAFQAYATGEWSITELTEELKLRGLTSRQTRVYVSKPLPRSHIHRMLTNPYYIGKIVHKGVVLPGAHELLIDEATWHKVQDMLATRKVAGERSWKHTHYLKGTLRCGVCGELLSFGYANNGKGGNYSYFFCLGRHTGRTRDRCNLPYIDVGKLEQAMTTYWHQWVKFTPEFLAELRPVVLEQLSQLGVENQRQFKQRQQHLARLEHKKQKLIEAYLNDVLPAEELRPLQDQIASEINTTKMAIAEASEGIQQVRERVDIVLDLMQHAGKLYGVCSDNERQQLNQALFEMVKVTVDSDNNDNGKGTNNAIIIEATPVAPVAALQAILTEVEQVTDSGAKAAQNGGQRLNTADVDDEASTSGEKRSKHKKKPTGTFLFTEGSNLTNLAGVPGFEPR